ncbi:MAG: LPS-assembly protein LptD [Stellaceae bacterium]
MRREIVVVLALLLASLPAWSKAAPGGTSATGAGATARPATGKRPYVVTADQVAFDHDLGLVVARGHVEISAGKEILLADTVTYNQHTDTATASGHVALLQPNGDVVFGDFMALRDRLKNGFVRNIRMLMSDGSRLAGNTARRLAGGVTEIRRGVYSPCDLCKDDPTRAPVWQIRAQRTIDDTKAKAIDFYDAEMQIDGLPVVWLPYFSVPEPSVKRASGFLTPVIGYSSRVGGRLQIPYFWAISPDKDMTFAPLFTTNAGTVLIDEYRQRFTDGRIDLTGTLGIGTPPVGVNNLNQAVTEDGVRGSLFGAGEIDLSDDWRATFGVQRSSDISYLLRYGFYSPQDFLTSYGTLENFQRDSYTNITAMAFQSLWPGVNDSSEPLAAPVAEYMYVMTPERIGGQVRLAANALNLVRLSGTSERRLSLGGSWQRPFDGLIGDRFRFTASLRGDAYYTTNLPDSDGAPSGLPQNAFAARAFPQAALDWRYPWIRRDDHLTELIEPEVMGVTAPDTGNYSRIPSEDTQSFTFDDTDLFVPNRLSGFDLVDTGSRVDYGLRGGVYSDQGGAVRFLVGQSYAFQNDSEFLPGSGLTTRLSDIVGRVTMTPIPDLNLIYRFRVAHRDFSTRTQEVAAAVGPPRLNLRLNYTELAASADYPYAVARREVGAALAIGLSSHWSTDFQELRDIDNNANLLGSAGVTYRDECLSATASVQQSGIEIGDVKPGVTVLFTVVLKNLGEFGLNIGSFQY